MDYGIGLVRLMGRNAGFIAMSASNNSRDVDICLVPEFKFGIVFFCGKLNVEIVWIALIESPPKSKKS